jgi:quercetin dioxygenase-like cupin family protein
VDVRNAKIEPTVEHEGTCLTYFMVPKESMRNETDGSYLEYVSEFELVPGARLEPHYHDTHEFFYLLEGNATMQIEAETQEVAPGDLVHIPRKATHSIWPTDPEQGFRALAFAVSFQPPGAQPVHLSRTE